MVQTSPRISLIQLLAGNNFLQVNRTLCKNLGAITAIILSEMCSMYVYLSERKGLSKINGTSDWFYLTIDEIEEKLGITRKQQDAAIEKLVDTGLLEYKVTGLPAKRYFRINQENLLIYFSLDESRDKIVDSNSSYSLYQSDKLDCPKGTNPYIDIIPESTRSDNIKDNVSHKNLKTEKTLEPYRKFKLTDDQKGVVDWLKERIKNTNDETLCFWAKTHDFEKISTCYNEALSRNPRDLGAYLNKLLTSAKLFPNAKLEECRQFAKDFLETHDLDDAKIGKKYLTYGKGKAKMEISFSQEPDVFARQLLAVFQNQKTKRGI